MPTNTSAQTGLTKEKKRTLLNNLCRVQRPRPGVGLTVCGKGKKMKREKKPFKGETDAKKVWTRVSKKKKKIGTVGKKENRVHWQGP